MLIASKNTDVGAHDIRPDEEHQCQSKATDGSIMEQNSNLKPQTSALTDVPGIRVGHHTDEQRGTGCTVVLCEEGAIIGVDVRGGAPGTRETDALRPASLVDVAHAVLLTGGSAFGLAAADGVMLYLRERQRGYAFNPDADPELRVPIVPAAVVYDLSYKVVAWPSAEDGYAACLRAASEGFEVGSVGAGTGATVGKLQGIAAATKGGLGSASITLPDGSIVAALMVVNAFGDVRDAQGRLIAGPCAANGSFVDTVAALSATPLLRAATGGNTTIGVVATNVPLNREAATTIARMAHDGLSRAIHPCHTLLDGDTIFALGAGGRGEIGPVAVSQLGVLAAEVTARAVRSIWS
jgi:L-aminopeptidase/D-esterase-like protein